jgi:hypothetical protein
MCNWYNFYIMQVNNKTLVVLGLYVDDLMIILFDDHYWKHCKAKLNEEFAITNKRDISCCLAIQIIRAQSIKSMKLS